MDLDKKYTTYLNGRDVDELKKIESLGLKHISDNPNRVEAVLFKSLCIYENYKTIVEIGTQHGESTFYLCQAAELNGGKVFCYDYFAEVGTYKKGGYGEREVVEKRLEHFIRKDLVKLTTINSRDDQFQHVLKTDTGGCIDFAFIDGDHSYDGARNDFEKVYPLLSNNGMIVFHDTGNHVGVRKLIIELLTDLNDGTFSIINMPYGGPSNSRQIPHGIAILKKNGWAKESRGITTAHLFNAVTGATDWQGNDEEIIVEDVYKKEKLWYNRGVNSAKKGDKMNIKVFYDGVNIENNCGEDVDGFTTNISFVKQGGITDYDAFISNSLKYSNGRPISFQLFDDDDENIEKTARKICSYDQSIFVKIPIMKTNGESNAHVIKKLHDDGLKINVTAIFTKDQIDWIKDCFGTETSAIVSIFAGRINDCGHDSTDVVQHANETFSHLRNVEILWAACRTVYNMVEAEKQGADIVTVPDSVLQRRHRLGEVTYEASLGAVKQFREDGITGNISFENK